uniref:TLC domain-containing protein n=1 Tax=Ciona savignyi TaxID=51511 RepID=H2YWR9_CIOSA
MANTDFDYYEPRHPTYRQFATDVYHAMTGYWKKLESHDLTPHGWWSTLRQNGSCDVNDVIAVIVSAYLWTILRETLTKGLFKPLAKVSGLSKKDQAKTPECLWKLFFSTIAWSYSAFLVLYRYDLFHHPSLSVQHWNLHSRVPLDLYIAYVFQLSYYAHSIYATTFLDEWRKDSSILLLHHVFTILLLTSSYLFRYTLLGALVLFFHDFSDIFLELTKLMVYYKTKGGVWARWCETLSTAGFVAFGTSWFVFRLYWFPLKAIYVSAYISSLVEEKVPPFYFFTNGLMLALLVMHLYWFKFILHMAYKVCFGKTKEIKDTREYEERVASMGNGVQQRKQD